MINQKGNILSILVVPLLIIGLVAGVFLITSGNPLKLFSKAGGDSVAITFDTNKLEKKANENFQIGVEIKPGTAEVIGADITFEYDDSVSYIDTVVTDNVLDVLPVQECGVRCLRIIALNTDESLVRSGLLKPVKLNFTTRKEGSGTVSIKEAAIVTSTGVLDPSNIDISGAFLSYTILSESAATAAQGNCSASYQINPSQPAAGDDLSINVTATQSSNFNCVILLQDNQMLPCQTGSSVGNYTCQAKSISAGRHSLQLKFGEAIYYPSGTSCGQPVSCNTDSYQTQ